MRSLWKNRGGIVFSSGKIHYDADMCIVSFCDPLLDICRCYVFDESTANQYCHPMSILNGYWIADCQVPWPTHVTRALTNRTKCLRLR